MELNDRDFDRMHLRIKTIKIIQRLQKELEAAPVIEEYIDEDTEEVKLELAPSTSSQPHQQENVEHMDTEQDEEDDEDGSQDNPYKGIRLEKVCYQ